MNEEQEQNGDEVEGIDDSDVSEGEDLPLRANVSALKLQNSSFSRCVERQGILTHWKSINVGLGVASASGDQTAIEYKLQDATLLSDCIGSAAICSISQKSQSRLQLYQQNY